MSNLWYVMRSKPNKETFLTGQLELHHIEFYYPQLKVHPVNPRCRKIQPYFPGYLFIQANIGDYQANGFDRIPGAIGLVRLGGEIAWVPENIIRAIQVKIDRINDVGGEIFAKLKKGDPVRIDSGPFEGYEAIFDSRMTGTERVKVLLTMLQKRVLQVELPAGSISPIKATPFLR